MTRFHIGILAAVSLTALQGCTMMAPTYTPSIANVQTLKDAPFTGAKIATFAGSGATSDGMGSIGLRIVLVILLSTVLVMTVTSLVVDAGYKFEIMLKRRKRQHGVL